MRDYHKLRAFELADQLALAIYKCTKSFPKEEMFGLTSQIRRASVSAPSNTRQQREKTTLDFDDLFDIARQFAVSVPALVFRCKEEGIIQGDVADRVLTQIQGRTHFWEKRKNYPPPKRPFRFEALAFEAIGKGLIGTGKFADFMGITRHQAMKLLEEREEDFWQEGNSVEIEIADP
jgi:four helix bundle protein